MIFVVQFFIRVSTCVTCKRCGRQERGKVVVLSFDVVVVLVHVVLLRTVANMKQKDDHDLWSLYPLILRW